MGITVTGSSEFGLEATAGLLARGFSDYFVPLSFSDAAFERMVAVDSLDLAASRVVLHDGVPGGVALIARRGPTSRLAGMAIVPEARKRGLGRALVERLVAEARDRGDRAMVLEVIEQNDAAVRLYEGAGFRKVRRLVGFEGKGASGPAEAGPLEEVDAATAAAVLRDGIPDLPWQMSGATLAQLTPPCRVFRFEGAWAAVLNLESSPVTLRGFGAEADPGKQGHAVALLRALMARYPGKQWRLPAMWPEELSEAFLAAGLVRSPLSQWQMARSLT
jgi:ribosomal protein S18 acetylase RimI-like enzyme